MTAYNLRKIQLHYVSLCIYFHVKSICAIVNTKKIANNGFFKFSSDINIYIINICADFFFNVGFYLMKYQILPKLHMDVGNQTFLSNQMPAD